MPRGVYTRIPARTRFWKFVAKGGQADKPECWVWMGSVGGSMGYGVFWYQGKNRRAHVVSWAFSRSGRALPELPKNHLVLHKCDNPACVRPKHLFAGSQKDNIRDKHAKGRAADQRGEKGPTAKLTNAQAEEIRRLLSLGDRVGDVARKYGVSSPTVTNIRKRLVYA
jgi:hypothetical protein